jgi:hypothetical protein
MASERPNRFFTILIWVGLLAIAWSLPVIDLVSRLQHRTDSEVTRYYQPGKPDSWYVQQSQSERPLPSKDVRG